MDNQDFFQIDDLWDIFYANIPDLHSSGFICSKRKYCSYRIPNSRQFKEIGLFIQTVGFNRIKENIDIKYRDCVSKKQVKQIWSSKGNRVPLLAGEITRALLTISSKDDYIPLNWKKFLTNLGARMESAQKHQIATNCHNLGNLLVIQCKRLDKDIIKIGG